MGVRFFLVVLVMLVLKSLIFFAAWNFLFIDMLTILKPISVAQAFGVTLCVMLLTFTYMESK